MRSRSEMFSPARSATAATFSFMARGMRTPTKASAVAAAAGMRFSINVQGLLCIVERVQQSANTAHCTNGNMIARVSMRRRRIKPATHCYFNGYIEKTRKKPGVRRVCVGGAYCASFSRILMASGRAPWRAKSSAVRFCSLVSLGSAPFCSSSSTALVLP